MLFGISSEAMAQSCRPLIQTICVRSGVGGRVAGRGMERWRGDQITLGEKSEMHTEWELLAANDKPHAACVIVAPFRTCVPLSVTPRTPEAPARTATWPWWPLHSKRNEQTIHKRQQNLVYIWPCFVLAQPKVCFMALNATINRIKKVINASREGSSSRMLVN